MKKNLLASDYDGTWKTTKEALEKNIADLKTFQKNNLFGFVTGRNVDYMDHRCHSMNIKYDFLVACNGAYCQANNQEKKVYIEEKMIEEIYQLVKNDVMSFSLFTASAQYEPINRRPLIKKIGLAIKRRFSEKECMYKSFTTQEVMMIECQGDSIESTHKIRKLIEERYSHLVSIAGDKNWFDITPKAANKKAAMSWVAKQYSLPESAIFTVGDGENDLEMLKAFNGYRIVKPNGFLEDKIKNKVNEVNELMQSIISEREL